jgi:hypothetical protein
LLIRGDNDWGADGTIDVRNTFGYDHFSRRTLWQSDRGLDGVVNQSETYEYDRQGNMIHSVMTDHDNPMFSWEKFQSFDGQGNLLVIEQSRADGTVSYQLIYGYECHE